MKTLLSFLALLLFAPPAQADYYVKQHSHTDEYYQSGRVSPARDSESEYWLGENRMRYETELRIIIIDRKKQTLIFANKSDSTFAEAPLPLDWAALVPEDLAARLKTAEAAGTVEPAGEKRKIDGYACSAYKIKTYVPYKDKKLNERAATLWITNDLPRAAAAFATVAPDIFKLRNYSDELSAELLKMGGFLMLEETLNYRQGMSYKSTDRVVEVREREPPDDAYTLPEWFEKKKRLSRADLEGE